MANQIDVSKLIGDVADLNKQIKNTSDLLSELITKQGSLNKELLGAKGLKDAQDALNKSKSNQNEIEKQGEALLNQRNKAVAAQDEALRKLTTDTIKAKEAAANHTKEIKAEGDAYKKLDLEHKKAIANARTLAAQYGKGSQQAKQAAAEANKLGKELKGIRNTTGSPDANNVGKYFQAIMKGAGALGLIAGAAEIAKAAFNRFVGSTQSFKDKWEQGVNALDAGINVLQGSFRNISNGGFSNFNQKLDEAIEKSLELTKKIQQLRIEAVAVDFKTNELRLVSEMYKMIADDATLSFETQLEYGEKAFEKTKERVSLELELNKNKYLAAEETNKNITESGKKLTVEDIERLKESRIAYDNSKAEFKKIDLEYARFKRQINLDDFEQELDFIFDVGDKRKTANEKDIANTEKSALERVRILGETKRILNESFDDQINLFNKEFDLNIDRNKLLTLNNKESYEYAKSLGMSEKATNRLLEVIRERIAAVSDLEVAQRGLNKTLQIEPLSLKTTDFVKKQKFSNLQITDDMKKDLADRLNANLEYLKAVEDAERMSSDMRKQLQLDFIGYSGETVNILFDLAQSNRQRELDSLGAEYEAKMTAAEGNKELQIKLAAELKTKQDQLKREQAQSERNQALFNIAMTTAEKGFAIKAQASLLLSNPVTAPLAANSYAQLALLLAFAGIQTAAILSQPLPGFFTGTESAPEGLAWVAEKGRELIENEGKFTLADKPQLMDMQGGEKVYNNRDTERMLNAAIYKDIAINGNEGIENRLDSLLTKVDKLKQVNINFDANGFNMFTQKGNSITHYINRKSRK